MILVRQAILFGSFLILLNNCASTFAQTSAPLDATVVEDSLLEQAKAWLDLGRKGQESFHFKISAASLHRAIEIDDRILLKNNVQIEALANKSEALLVLARLQTTLSEYIAAQSSIDSALSICDDSILKNPTDMSLHLIRQEILLQQAFLQSVLAQYADAEKTYKMCFASIDRIRRCDSKNSKALKLSARGIYGLGQLMETQSREAEATEFYEQALITYREAVRRDPNDLAQSIEELLAFKRIAAFYEQVGNGVATDALITEAVKHARNLSAQNSGSKNDQILGMLNDLLALQAILPKDAADYRKKARDAFDKCLFANPENIHILDSQATALFFEGQRQYQQAALESAKHFYNQSIASRTRLLSISPNNAESLMDLASAQDCISIIEAKKNNKNDSHAARIAARNALSKAEKCAPESLNLLCGQVLDWMTFANLAEERNQAKKAYERVQVAITICLKLIDRSPNDRWGQENLAYTYQKAGDLLEDLHHHGQACASFQKSDRLLVSLIAKGPQRERFYNCRAAVLQRLGSAQQKLKMKAVAEKTYTAAGDIASEGLIAYPKSAKLMSQRGHAFILRGQLESFRWKADNERAVISFNIARSAFSDALSIDPLNAENQMYEAYCYLFAARSQNALGRYELAEQSSHHALICCAKINPAKLLLPWQRKFVARTEKDSHSLKKTVDDFLRSVHN